MKKPFLTTGFTGGLKGGRLKNGQTDGAADQRVRLAGMNEFGLKISVRFGHAMGPPMVLTVGHGGVVKTGSELRSSSFAVTFKYIRVGRSMFMFFSVGTRSRRLFSVMGQFVEPMAESEQLFADQGVVLS